MVDSWASKNLQGLRKHRPRLEHRLLAFLFLTQFLRQTICTQRIRRDPSNRRLTEHGTWFLKPESLSHPLNTRKNKRVLSFSAPNFSINIWTGIHLLLDDPNITHSSSSSYFGKSASFKRYHNNIKAIRQNSYVFDWAVFDRMLYSLVSVFSWLHRKEACSQIRIRIEICDSCRFFGCN